MEISEYFTDVAVVGAAGKMGCEIALLLAQEMAFLKISQPDKSYVLHLIDQNQGAVDGLYRYLRSQAFKVAEKQISKLRALYQDRQELVENSEIIQEFVATLLSLLRPGICLESLEQSQLIFEAIVEEEKVKINLLKKLSGLCHKQSYFFTNASSFPIHVLAEKSGLKKRLIGFHFYNPPAVQKLAELILTEDTNKELRQLAEQLALRLKKKIVYSKQ